MSKKVSQRAASEMNPVFLDVVSCSDFNLRVNSFDLLWAAVHFPSVRSTARNDLCVKLMPTECASLEQAEKKQQRPPFG